MDVSGEAVSMAHPEFRRASIPTWGFGENPPWAYTSGMKNGIGNCIVKDRV